MMSFLIKPASGQCNLRCPYCFYCAETQLRNTESFGMMSIETAERLIDYAFEGEKEELSLAFQGGEPMLRGLAFFEHIVSYARNKAPKGMKLHYALQTNGTLIDETWARFFVKEGFLVGLSLDGTRRYQDLYRIDAQGRGSFDRVFRAAEILRKEGAEFNILTVVTRQVAENIHKIFPFFCRQGFQYQQYIPCLDPFGEDGRYPWSLDEKIFGDFLIELFRLWYGEFRRGRYISIRYFDNLILMLRGQRPESCGMEGFCTRQHVAEADGSLYPCDFYCLDEYRLGTVRQSPAEIERRRGELRFLEESLPLHEDCRACPCFALCRGGCRRQRDTTGRAPLGKNRFCAAYRRFLTYALPGLQEAARRL